MEEIYPKNDSSAVHRAEISRLKKTLGDNALVSDERKQTINEVLPVAQRLHELATKKAEIEEEISELRASLSEIDLDVFGDQKFEFGEFGSVSIKKPSPKFQRSILIEKLTSVSVADKRDLESYGFLSIDEDIVPNQELLRQLSDEELERLIEKHKFLKRSVRYTTNAIQIDDENEKFVEELLEKGLLEHGENAVRVQTAKPGRKTRWERRRK